MFSFPKRARLLNARAYRFVFDGAEARASHRNLLLLARRNGLGQHRLGLVIPKKHVRRAVQRNRIKRVVREFFRLQAAPGLEGGDSRPAPSLDVILLARSGIEQLDNAALCSILRQQWKKLPRQ